MLIITLFYICDDFIIFYIFLRITVWYCDTFLLTVIVTSGPPGAMGHPGPEGPKGQKGTQGTQNISS